MSVGSDNFPVMHPVKGFQLGTTCAGVKAVGRKDLVVMKICSGSSIAGVFTRNAFCAAPVQIAKNCLASHSSNRSNNNPSLLVTNTGNANAGTGDQGLSDAKKVCASLALLSGVSEMDVFPFSTGVIGEPLPVEKIIAALPAACSELSELAWKAAADGILTTDTRPKGASTILAMAGEEVTITGIAKGAGMIKPNMATMLAYIATDIEIDQSLLQTWAQDATDVSFNRITIDGDTSTNDCVMMVATGQSGVKFSSLSDANQREFQHALQTLFIDLAQQIIKDGEGATKFVSVIVEGGSTQDECLSVAYAVAESPLVKTALFASDPNWGRILAAVGRAGIDGLKVDEVQLFLGDVLIAENGGRANSYTEQQGQTVMDQQEISIRICLNRGECYETVWTTDLSYDYVKINAEYRT